MLGLQLGLIYFLAFLINYLHPYTHTVPTECHKIRLCAKKNCAATLGLLTGAGHLLRNAFVTWKNLWEETSQGAVNGFGFFYSVLRDRCFSLRLPFHLSLCNVLHDPTANRVLTAMLVPQPGKLSQLQQKSHFSPIYYDEVQILKSKYY